jgi:hypothetical protein
MMVFLNFRRFTMTKLIQPKNPTPPNPDGDPDMLPVDPDKGPTPDLLPDDPSRDGVTTPTA